MKKIVNFMSKAAILVLMLSLTGCYYDELQVEAIPDPEPGAPDISFSTEIQSIFTANDCMRCHDSGRAPDLRVGFAYAAVVPSYVTPNDPDASLLLTKLIDGHRSVNTTDLALIKAWINQGAQNN